MYLQLPGDIEAARSSSSLSTKSDWSVCSDQEGGSDSADPALIGQRSTRRRRSSVRSIGSRRGSDALSVTGGPSRPGSSRCSSTAKKTHSRRSSVSSNCENNRVIYGSIIERAFKHFPFTESTP